jgi:tripartite-type tricarboxylate transporter receptor subunit TctC
MTQLRRPARRRAAHLSAALLAGVLLTACGGAETSPAASGAGHCADLEGERVTLVVGYSPGGGYDVYARLLAPTLAEKLGADVIVENQPGAGGLLALNNLQAADKDGTVIGIMNGIGAGGAALAGAEGVTGFDGSSEVEVALLQGYVDGMSGQLDSRRPALESGDQTPLLTVDRERAGIAHDTPTLLELDLTDEQRELAESHLNLLDLGRPIVGPPGMDGAALTCLRTAFDEAVADPELVATAEAQDRPLNPLTGQELDEVVRGLQDAPAEYLQVLRSSF